MFAEQKRTIRMVAGALEAMAQNRMPADKMRNKCQALADALRETLEELAQRYEEKWL